VGPTEGEVGPAIGAAPGRNLSSDRAVTTSMAMCIWTIARLGLEVVMTLPSGDVLRKKARPA